MQNRIVVFCIAALVGPSCGSAGHKKMTSEAAQPAAASQAAGSKAGSQAMAEKAPLLEGMGTFHWPISTKDPVAQRLFDQGMVLSYGFNHAEAARSFRYAARLDPTCAMCWWGAALVLGPNINATMEADAVAPAAKALAKAIEHAPKVTREEQLFIDALSKRYTASPPADRTPLDRAYADAICGVAKQLTENVNAMVLCAEARMDLHPWNYWVRETGEPQPWTPDILALLESAMEAAPDHPGANHLYIHAVEASRNPARGLPAAQRLADLVPGAGHLVHMPAHIYIRTGRYSDASEANERAIKADENYVSQCREQGIYPLAYKPHNWHFLWATATLEGRSRRAIEAAEHLGQGVPEDKMSRHGMGTLQHYKVTPLYAYVRFGKWDEILAMQEPPADLAYPRAAWTYARAMAHIFTNDLREAENDLARLRTLATDPALEGVTIWDINTTKALLAIAVEVAAGELDAKQNKWKTAISHLEKALELELALNYDEPAAWYYPVRHALGAVYLEAGRPKDAERVYRADLVELPDNGFALFGLKQALLAQGKTDEAQKVDALFRKAWRNADHTLTSSRF